MKIKCIRISILVYFLTDSLNGEVLWGREKYLLDSLYEKLQNKVSFKINVNSKESVSSKDKKRN